MLKRHRTWAGTLAYRCVFALALAWLTMPASAAIFLINASGDTQDAVPGDGSCADSAGNCTLRAAVQEANATPGVDTIQLPAGTYTLAIPGNAEHAAATGDLDITAPVNIIGAGADQTVIDAAGVDRIFECIHAGTVLIRDMTLQNGVAGVNTPGYFMNQVGGAISNVGDTSTLTLRDVIIRNNSALSGGGIYNIFSTLHVHDSTIHDNQATNGNGGGIAEGLAAYTRLYNVTLSGNSAAASGGGMATSNNTPLLYNVTITNNTADSDNNGSGNGGGIAKQITAATVRNSIIAGNQDLGGEAPDCSDSLTTGGYNLIGNNAGCTITPAAGDQIGTAVTPLAPRLAPLALDGGATPVHSLLNGSPAIDAGNPANPGSGGDACQTFDQRGSSRADTAPCDIGAYESSPGIGLTFTVNTTADLVDAIIGDGRCETAPANNECSLRASIQEANARVGEDTIILPAGLFRLTRAGANENAAVTGDLDIDDVLTISGDSAATTIIDANGIDRAIEVRMGGDLTMSHVTVQNGIVTGNGGGIMHQASGDISLSQCVIRDNTANGPGSSGGGIFIVAFSTLTLDDCIISNNTANTYGGGIANFTFSTALISNSRITGNISNTTGGGLMNSFRSNAIISNSTLDSNRSQQGGGIGTRWGSGTVTLINSTLSGNTGTFDGGGVYVATSDTLNLRNATVSDNLAMDPANGGGIANYGIVNARNSVVAGNRDSGGEAPDCSGTFTSQGYNFVGDNTGCSIAAASGDQVGTSSAPLDPLLDSLTQNQGSTPTHAILPGSPLLDAGNPATAGTGGTSCESQSQNAVDRILNNPCDIGAYEVRWADVGAALSTTQNPAYHQSTISYDVTITNQGPDNAESLTMTFLSPAGSTLIDATGTGWTCTETAGVITCTTASLGLNSTTSLQIEVTTGSQSLDSAVTAYVTASTRDPNSGNDSATLVQSIVAAPILETTPPASVPPIEQTISDETETTSLSNIVYGTPIMPMEKSVTTQNSASHEPSIQSDAGPEQATNTSESHALTEQQNANDQNASPSAESAQGQNKANERWNSLIANARRSIADGTDSDFARLSTHNGTEEPSNTDAGLQDAGLWLALDDMKSAMAKRSESKLIDRDLLIDAAQTSSIFLAAGITNWYLKSSALLASMLSTLPLWTPFDPLPVLALSRREKRRRKAKAQAEREAENRANAKLANLIDPTGKGAAA